MAFGIRPMRAYSALLAVLFLPALATAAGFEVPENGAPVIARGGTSTNLLGTAYGLQFNPAGMTAVRGLDVRIDTRMVDHRVGFTRASTDQYEFNPVENSAGPFFAPMVALAYRPESGGWNRFAFGVGIWGPPGVGRYRYPTVAEGVAGSPEHGELPDDNEYRTEVAGQRYSLIESNLLIVLPTVGAAWQATDTLSLGLNVQAVWASVGFRQALSAEVTGGENPNFDADIDLKATNGSRLVPAVTLGAAWNFAPGWILHSSFRPAVSIEGEGDIDVRIPDSLAQIATVDGDTTKLFLRLPAVLRAGVGFAQGRFSGAAEFIYEGWRALDEIRLEPDVRFKIGNDVKELNEFVIPKNWQDSYGARLGASYRLADELSGRPSVELHSGAVFESNAIPSAYQAVDFVTGTRFGGSFGVTVGYKGFGMTVGALGFLPSSFEVTDSEVEQAKADETLPPIYVGNGTYRTSAWVGAISLSYTGLGAPAAPAAPMVP